MLIAEYFWALNRMMQWYWLTSWSIFSFDGNSATASALLSTVEGEPLVQIPDNVCSGRFSFFDDTFCDKHVLWRIYSILVTAFVFLIVNRFMAAAALHNWGLAFLEYILTCSFDYATLSTSFEISLALVHPFIEHKPAISGVISKSRFIPQMSTELCQQCRSFYQMPRSKTQLEHFSFSCSVTFSASSNGKCWCQRARSKYITPPWILTCKNFYIVRPISYYACFQRRIHS